MKELFSPKPNSPTAPGGVKRNHVRQNRGTRDAGGIDQPLTPRMSEHRIGHGKIIKERFEGPLAGWSRVRPSGKAGGAFGLEYTPNFGLISGKHLANMSPQNKLKWAWAG